MSCWLTTIGLGLDIVGVVLLFWFGIPPKIKTPKEWKDKGFAVPGPYRLITLGEGADVTGGADDAERVAKNFSRPWIRRRERLGWASLGLILVGFGLQAVAVWVP